MSMNLSLLKKIRCRFLDRSTGMPVSGVIASLSVAIGGAPKLVQLPVATLCTDATGYMSFDLKPLIDLGLVTASGLLISAPKFGLTNYDLLGSLVAATHDGAKNKDLYAGGFDAAKIAEMKELSCIVFPIYLENCLRDEHGSESKTCESSARLPSIQSPDVYDYKVSPFSFVTPAALKLGNGCCETLLPSSLPIQQYRFYKVIMRRDDISANGVAIEDTPLGSRVSVFGALKSPVAVIKFGEILEYKQDWYSLGHSLGEIKYSLPLAPGESVQLAVIEWSRDDLSSRTDRIRATEFLEHDSRRDRAIEDTVEAALREEQGGYSLMGGTSGIATGSQYVTWTGNHAIGGGISYSYGNRDLNGESLQDLHDRVRQASSSIRSLNSTVIVQASQTEKSALQTRRVANHNHCHALTIQYYEVLRHYRMITKFSGRRQAVLVPFEPFAFTSWERALRFRTVLEQTLLDPSLRNCFEALIRLNLAPTVYDAPQVTKTVVAVPPKITEIEKAVEVKGSKGKGVGSGVIVRKDDKIKMIASGLLAVSGGSGYGSGGFGPEGDGRTAPQGGNYPFIAPGLLSFSLIYKIGLTDSWRQGSETIELTADKDGEIIFGVNNMGNGFVDFGRVGAESWTVALKYPSHETDTPTSADPSKDDASNNKDLPFRKRDDELCSARLLMHLKNNQGFYNGAVWMFMDAVERRLYLEDALKGRPEILYGIDDKPLAISGNYVAFQYSGPLSLSSKPSVPVEDIEDIITLPTRGLFAEAQMGHCNSCEKRDVTRMSDWTEMTVETPPEISGISPGPKGAAPSIAQGQLPSNVIQITQPQAAPDPTGLANALSVLKTPDIFRDMAGLDEVSKLLGELVKASGDANSKALSLQVKEKVDGIRVSGGGAVANTAGKALPSETDAGKQIDKLDAIQYARDKGLIDQGQGTNAAKGVLGGADTFLSDAGTMEDKVLAPINLDKYCTPAARSFSPGNPLAGKSADNSGKTTLRAVVNNAPAGSTWHWSVVAPTSVNIVSPSSYITEVVAGDPGLSEVTFEARASDGTSLGKETVKLSVPQFVVIDEDAAAFNAQLAAYHLDDVKAALLQKTRQVVDFLLANANARTVWHLSPFNELAPGHLLAGGFAAGKFNQLTIRGVHPVDPRRAGETAAAGAGPAKPNEAIDIYPAAYRTPGTDVGTDVASIVNKIAALNMTDPEIKNIWIEIMARLLGETVAHEIHHALLGGWPGFVAGHNPLAPFGSQPLIPFDLLNVGQERLWLQRTGIEILKIANFPQPGSYRDGGMYAISSLQAANQTKIDSVFPVPPAFL